MGQGRIADKRGQKITAVRKAELRSSGIDLPGRNMELERVGVREQEHLHASACGTEHLHASACGAEVAD